MQPTTLRSDHRPLISRRRPHIEIALPIAMPAARPPSLLAAALRRKPMPVAAADSGGGTGLVRRLGLFELVLLGVGASIGAGIFVVTGTVARDAGPGVTVSFLLASAVCVLNALCYAELASRFPAVVGGAYLYAYCAFNEITSFLTFVQMMLDYHIGAASIARSLASYLVQFLELFPLLDGHIPSWIGHGLDLFGGVISINLLAPVVLIMLTAILCYGVKESSALNSFMTILKVSIVTLVVLVGAFEVDATNWTPFAPNGFKSVVTGATVVFFAYTGFDAVANCAEESKHPQRDLPLGILGSLVICAVLYVSVCLVITGMVPYTSLGEDAPLAEAFVAKGLKFISVLISIGAVAGLSTTLLVGLYVQARLYLGLGRDGLLPSLFARVHPVQHTPLNSQIWCGCVAAVLAGFFNVHILSHTLSVGTLTGNAVVSASVLTMRWKSKGTNYTPRCASSRTEGILCIVVIALGGFAAGLCYRYSMTLFLYLVALVATIAAGIILQTRHAYDDPPGFSCPGVPALPNLSIFFNMFMFAQLHEEAWIRFVILSIVAIGIYAAYGRYNSVAPSSDREYNYDEVPTLESWHE